MPHQQLDARRPARRDHFVGLLGSAGQRLFAHDMLARARRTQHQRVMRVRGRANVHHVHRCEQRVQVVVWRRAVLLMDGARAFCVLVKDGGKLRGRLRPGRRVELAHEARAHQAHFEHGHCSSTLFDSASRQPSDQLPREEDVQDDHWHHRQRQRGQYRVPVHEELPQENLCPQRDGLVLLGWC